MREPRGVGGSASVSASAPAPSATKGTSAMVDTHHSEAPGDSCHVSSSDGTNTAVIRRAAAGMVEAAREAAIGAAGRTPPSFNRLGADDVVVIAGGGVSGLALAAALQAWPVEVRPRVVVLERDPSSEARRQGYGVTLSETNAALGGLGILDELRGKNTRSCAHWTFHASGRVLGYYGAAFLPAERRAPSPVTNLRVPRNEVREVLLRRLRPGTVRFGRRAVGYTEHPGGKGGAGGYVEVEVEVVADDETDATSTNEPGGRTVGGGAGRLEWCAPACGASVHTMRASLLVAADGVRSAVQRARLPNDRLNYLGVVLVTGFTTLRHPLLRGQGFYTLDGERARIFTMPFKGHGEEGRGAGWEGVYGTRDEDEDEDASGDVEGKNGQPPMLTMWQISVAVPEEEARSIAAAPRRGPGGAKEFVERVTRGWHDPVPAMFDAALWDESWAGPLYDRDEPPPPPKGGHATSRVIAIGDAAHPMSPFKGMGANSALFDAWALADWLRRAPVPRAVACFEREMIARAWVKVRASRVACTAFHSAAAVDAPPEFAGVDPRNAAAFLGELHARGVGAGLGGKLERRAAEVLAETVGEEGVKPYAYLKRGGGVRVRNDAPRHAQTDGVVSPAVRNTPSGGNHKPERQRTGNGRGRDAAVSPALRSRVLHAVASGLCQVGAGAMRDAAEEETAGRLVPAVKYQRGCRPAHDWVSRVALKIVHARRRAENFTAKKLSDDGTFPIEAAEGAMRRCAVSGHAGSQSAPVADDSGSRPVGGDGARPDVVAAAVRSGGEVDEGAEVGEAPSDERLRLARVAKKKAKKAERKEKFDDAEVLALARAIADALNASAVSGVADDPVAAARVAPDGQILITSADQARDMAAKGLAMCAGCGQFYATHGGGLRQHWARGGVDQACAAAATAAGSAALTDEEAAAAIGGSIPTAGESSAWRGSGEGRPKPWRGKKSNEQRLHPGLAAAAAGDVAGMSAAADDGWDPVTYSDAYGSDALQWAAGGGHLVACHWLVLEKGFRVGATRRKDGRTPLHWAARNGHLEVCRWLVAQGADPRVRTYDGDSPFNLAVWQGHREVAEWLAHQPGVNPRDVNRWGCNALLWACIQHDTSGGGGGGCGTLDDDVRPKPGEVDERGDDLDGGGARRCGIFSPLPMVRWLVETLRVPTDILNVNGHSALHKCAIYGHGDVISYMLRHTECRGSEHMQPDDRGATPSALAAQNGYARLAAQLRELEDKTMRLPVVYAPLEPDGFAATPAKAGASG